MTTWNLHLTEQTDTVLRTLAALDTDDPAVMAATLRAVADRLDPPQSTYRRGDHLRAARVANRDPLARTFENEGPSRRSLITTDSCGPEHTYTGSCAYAATDRPDPGF